MSAPTTPQTTDHIRTALVSGDDAYLAAVGKVITDKQIETLSALFRQAAGEVAAQ